VAVVGIDALGVPASLVRAARKQIQQACGIDPNSVLIAASHSHTAGPLLMVQPGQYDHASSLVQRLAYELSSCADAEYIDFVTKQIVEAVVTADGEKTSARCGIGVGHEDKAAYNRRFRMKNGLTYTHPGRGNPDILEPAGPIDPAVGVIGVVDENDHLMGCVVNYACHGTCGTGGTSADWIYYLEQIIRGGTDEDAIVVFLNGACGDVTQVNNMSPYMPESGERWAQFVGRRVGAEALKVLASVELGDQVPVVGRNRTLSIKRRVPNPERVRRCLELVQQDPAQADRTEWTFAKEIVLLDALLQKEPVANVEVQAIQIGPAVLLANPSEFFCELGLELRARCHFPFTFPVELANDCVGYVPTEEAMGEHGGGYETRLTSYSNLDIRAGKIIVEELLGLSRELTPGPVPERPKAPPFVAPWSYGCVPPELE